VTRLGLRPYRAGDDPPLASVPVSVVVLTRDEEANIGRCLASAGWADQRVVVDSGSADATVAIARSQGAQVVDQPWLGFSGQREFALRLPELRNDWVYFVDADEWVSPQLAAEIAESVGGAGAGPAEAAAGASAGCVAFSHRLRLVFQGTWIAHCGWYQGSWVVRLVDRRHARFDGSLVGERARVDGPVRRLRNDIVDEDAKGLPAWLHKHVRYAELEARRRGRPAALTARVRALRQGAGADTRPLARAVLKDVVYPSVPAKPAVLFAFMYLIRLGFLDGRAGLRFCLFHAWFEVTVAALAAQAPALQREERRWERARPAGQLPISGPSAAPPARPRPRGGSGRC
jgi:glycosyltransferase involved in cell wall biosynthesis